MLCSKSGVKIYTTLGLQGLNTREYTIKQLAKYTIHTRKIKCFNRYTKIHTRKDNLLIHEYTIHDFLVLELSSYLYSYLIYPNLF